MGGCEQDSTKVEREGRELRWAKRGDVLNPPAGISFDGTPHRIFCDGGAEPNPGPVGSGITVGKKESYATHKAEGCNRKATGTCECGLDWKEGVYKAKAEICNSSKGMEWAGNRQCINGDYDNQSQV
jgi:hypothetical protein